MSLPERLERRGLEPMLPNPYARERPGYSQPDAVDPSGYTVSDLPEHRGDGEISDVSPPRGVEGARYASAPYGDDTVHPVPGGALGEAGACSVPSLLGTMSLGSIGLSEQHAIRPAPLEYQGGLTPLRSSDLDGGRDERSAPSGAERAAPMSDSEVYADVYGVTLRPRRMTEDTGYS